MRNHQVTNEIEAIDGLAGWAVDVMDALGGPGAAAIVGLDNLFPPIPSELVLPLAGFTAGQGRFTLAEALVWTTVGSVLGAVLVYYLGALLGRDRIRRLLTRIPLLSAADFDTADAWFARHGEKAVFFGRMVPLVRSLISLPAGVQRMPLWRFLTLTTLGSLLWNTGFVLAGYALGANWQVVDDYAGLAQKAVLGVLAVLITVFVLRRLRSAAQRNQHSQRNQRKAGRRYQ